MTRTEAEEALQQHWAVYDEHVDEVADTLFKEVVVTFCQERGFQFVSGMGTYSLTRVDKKKSESDSYGGWNREDFDPADETAMRLFDILEMEIPGMPANSMGSIMPDHLP
jgi:hypothetical protein